MPLAAQPDIMPCLLCQQEAELRQSHIISKFIYKPLKREKGRMLVLSEDPEQANAPAQDGMKEYLLCDKCEQKRNKWETYFSNKWHRGELSRNAKRHRLRDLDYQKTKLFLLSTLLLASVSDDPLFAQIKLTTNRFVELRGMVDAGSPGHPYYFGCIANILREELVDTKAIVGNAITFPLEAARVHRFLFGGFLFAIVEPNGATMSSDMKDAFLKQDGSWLIREKPLRDLHYLVDTFFNLDRQGKLND